MLDAKSQASGSAKVKPNNDLEDALMLIGPPLIKHGAIKQIDVLATSSPIPARKGYRATPTP